MTSKVLVGVPTYNGFQRVDWLLNSIYLRSSENDRKIDYEIVICDDSGKDSHRNLMRDVINKWKDRLPIDLIINQQNLGISTSWNRIIKSKDSEDIILINDDILVDKGWLENMVYFIRNNPNAGAIFYDFIKIDERDIPNILHYSRTENSQVDISQTNFDHQNFPIRCMHYVGCFFGFNREKYDMVGGFDEEYFANFEETDFCTSLASYGFSSYIMKYPKSWHIYSATFKSAPELNYWNEFEKSERYYIKKWKGDRRFTENLYMSKIPPQKVKWIYNNNTYEEILCQNINNINNITLSEKENIVKIGGIDVVVKGVEKRRPKIGIGLPIGKDVNPVFLEMLFARFVEWIQTYTVVMIIQSIIPIDLARNKIVNSARQQNCDYLFFLDSDVLIEKGQLERLMSCDKDIISGVYYQKRPPYYPLPRKKVTENLYTAIEPEGNEPIEVDGTGMGCVLIKMNVFEKVHHPWFEFKYHCVHGKWDQLSEDLYFCQKLQNVGIKIYCDPIVQCSHIGTIVYPVLSHIHKEFRELSMKERDKTIAELSEFANISSEGIHAKWYMATDLVAKEYIEYMNQDHNNPRDFYKTNKNYIFELTRRHTDDRRVFDVELIRSFKEKYPFTNKILDFGSGCGQNAINLAEEGYDVAMADYEGFTSQFARFRSQKRGLNIKFYDIEEPINDKFDIILVYNVLEHVPDNEFKYTIDRLKSLKNDNGKILTIYDFNIDKSLYPMCYNTSHEKIELIQKLINE